MDINSNYNNTKLSFQARFISELPVKNVKRLANIQELFSQKTQQYAEDTLTLTKSKDSSFGDYPLLAFGKEMLCGDYRYSHIVDNMDELMQSMTDNQIVKKLINYFKVMKKEQQFDKYVDETDNSLKELRKVKKQNAEIAKNLLIRGKTTLSSRYRTLATLNKRKIEALEVEKAQKAGKILSDMEKIAINEPDLAHVPECIRDVEGLA